MTWLAAAFGGDAGPDKGASHKENIPGRDRGREGGQFSRLAKALSIMSPPSPDGTDYAALQ
jgi:hypothetical protein